MGLRLGLGLGLGLGIGLGLGSGSGLANSDPRCRLGELLDELQSAAKAVGNDELYLTFSEGAKLIQRDIVYAPSLYLES